MAQDEVDLVSFIVNLGHSGKDSRVYIHCDEVLIDATSNCRNLELRQDAVDLTTVHFELVLHDKTVTNLASGPHPTLVALNPKTGKVEEIRYVEFDSGTFVRYQGQMVQIGES